ncbi:MOK isoform 35 [Pan troglodytes]|uniref:MOK protein kinase n=5 Tax=Hominoidea TaxID=314295 RepID=H0YLZ5_HUMAN|nr:MOK isoform 29 [Pan troglodytes]PNI97230.1 MOK isoform 35 [Pan troglodytes]
MIPMRESPPTRPCSTPTSKNREPRTEARMRPQPSSSPFKHVHPSTLC